MNYLKPEKADRGVKGRGWLRGPQRQGEKWALDRNKERTQLGGDYRSQRRGWHAQKADRSCCCLGEKTSLPCFTVKGIQSLTGRLHVYRPFPTLDELIGIPRTVMLFTAGNQKLTDFLKI